MRCAREARAPGGVGARSTDYHSLVRRSAVPRSHRLAMRRPSVRSLAAAAVALGIMANCYMSNTQRREELRSRRVSEAEFHAFQRENRFVDTDAARGPAMAGAKYQVNPSQKLVEERVAQQRPDGGRPTTHYQKQAEELALAALAGDLQEMKWLLKDMDAGTMFPSTTPRGEHIYVSPLYVASQNSRAVPAVKLLLQHGADPNQPATDGAHHGSNFAIKKERLALLSQHPPLWIVFL
jgi:hypothetical protein